MLVFVISGFWHGAQWTFIIWGALHGSILIIENLTNKYNITLLKKENMFSDLVQILIVFFVTGVAWIFFRANSTAEAFHIISHLFDFSQPLASSIRGMTLYLGGPFWKLIACFVLILFLLFTEHNINRGRLTENTIIKQPPIMRWSIYTVLALSIFMFGAFDVERFIYFQF